MWFTLKAENRNGNAFEMCFDNLHDIHVAVDSIEKANETLDSEYKFYVQVTKSSSILSDDAELAIVL